MIWTCFKTILKLLTDQIITYLNPKKGFTISIKVDSKESLERYDVRVYGSYQGSSVLLLRLGTITLISNCLPEGSVKHTYFVAETRGLFSLQLKQAEQAKLPVRVLTLKL